MWNFKSSATDTTLSQQNLSDKLLRLCKKVTLVVSLYKNQLQLTT